MALDSSNDQRDRAPDHSVGVMDHWLRNVVVEVGRGGVNSLIPCTGSSAAVTAFAFGEIRQPGESRSSLLMNTEMRLVARGDLAPEDCRDAFFWFQLR